MKSDAIPQAPVSFVTLTCRSSLLGGCSLTGEAYASKITVPLMVLQGANDPRVLKIESDEIVAAAKKNGVPVEYIVFPGEGHGFVKKENEIKGYTAILSFLDPHLRRANQAR